MTKFRNIYKILFRNHERIDRRTTLKSISEKQDAKVWTSFNWSTIKITGMFL
jgi:hypothetical protein